MKKAQHLLTEHPLHERSKPQDESTSFLKGIFSIKGLSFKVLKIAIATEFYLNS